MELFRLHGRTVDGLEMRFRASLVVMWGEARGVASPQTSRPASEASSTVWRVHPDLPARTSASAVSCHLAHQNNHEKTCLEAKRTLVLGWLCIVKRPQHEGVDDTGGACRLSEDLGCRGLCLPAAEDTAALERRPRACDGRTNVSARARRHRGGGREQRERGETRGPAVIGQLQSKRDRPRFFVRGGFLRRARG